MNTMQKTLTALACSLLLAAQVQAADKVKIGFVSTLSGPSSALGVDIRDGFLLAVKLNQRGRGWVHVNPIPLNPTPGSIWTASDVDVQNEFVRRLNDAGIPTTLRDTRGKEIDGACGQLVATEEEVARYGT